MFGLNKIKIGFKKLIFLNAAFLLFFLTFAVNISFLNFNDYGDVQVHAQNFPPVDEDTDESGDPVPTINEGEGGTNDDGNTGGTNDDGNTGGTNDDGNTGGTNDGGNTGGTNDGRNTGRTTGGNDGKLPQSSISASVLFVIASVMFFIAGGILYTIAKYYNSNVKQYLVYEGEEEELERARITKI